MQKLFSVLFALMLLTACSDKEPDNPAPGPALSVTEVSVDGQTGGFTFRARTLRPEIRLKLSAPVQPSTIAGAVQFTSGGGGVLFDAGTDGPQSVWIRPKTPLSPFEVYAVSINTGLQSTTGGRLLSGVSLTVATGIDSSDKFTRITDTALVELVQRQTFRYFWDFAHPVSGLARERDVSGHTVTTGGSGFGVMNIIVGVHRNFITRAQGLARMQTIVSFLKNTADHFQGAFPHWLNGGTGKVVPFSAQDNGADLVETAFLVQGLLTARQFFTGADPAETALRNDINTIWRRVNWAHFRRGDENVLYWHWSPDLGWAMNMKIQGWNEALITYVLAAASPTHGIPKAVYDEGWARNGAMRNGNAYQGITLPLGPPYGGPMFFAHYSFLGLDPRGLSDAYADYWEQNRNHALIQHAYAQQNPRGFYGYSDSVWGLTASDDNEEGYRVHDPANDNGVITPTAALASFPYTPEASMKALKFFYYKLGDRIWGDYGFTDAFSLHESWFATSYLAIDQGPIPVMIENYRSGLLWNLFMSAPEVKNGLRTLGFVSPHL
ncbi:MAG TPA: glucoamylase family protein [Chitinophagaceae bacterium]|jgi:hypothetical protein|nr:glucoamylase family protein [Chitinophagaceae bacterium]